MALDGFTAGLNQSFEKPFGDNFDSNLLDRWMFAEPSTKSHGLSLGRLCEAWRTGNPTWY